MDAVMAELCRLGCDAELWVTRGPGDATELARRAEEAGFEVVAAAGGDGTVNEVLRGLVGGRAALAVVPLGMANVLAHELRMPFTPAGIAAVLAHGPPRRVHLGVAAGRHFLMMASTGFDTRVIAAVRADLKRRLGKLSYLGAGIATLARDPGPPSRVTVGGETVTAGIVVAANGSRYAGGFVVAPEARLEEPELTVCLFTGWRRFDIVRYTAALVLGRLDRLPDLRVLRARCLRVEALEPASGGLLQLDGELAVPLPAEIRIADETLSLIAPDSGAGRETAG
jgi:diacylglycerol kinase family enzyme